MSFFKFNKKIKTEDLKLSDYNQIWTKFCFLDETGVLSNQQEQYFTVGILKMSQPYYLQSMLFFERSKIKFYDEMKFNKLSKKLVDGSKYKIEIVNYLKSKLGAETFVKGFKNYNFNILVDKTDRLNMAQNERENEKGLSS